MGHSEQPPCRNAGQIENPGALLFGVIPVGGFSGEIPHPVCGDISIGGFAGDIEHVSFAGWVDQTGAGGTVEVGP